MLQQLSGKAWQQVTLNCKKLSIDETNLPVFKSDTGDITSVEMLSNSCQVTIVTAVGIMCNGVTLIQEENTKKGKAQYLVAVNHPEYLPVNDVSIYLTDASQSAVGVQLGRACFGY